MFAGFYLGFCSWVYSIKHVNGSYLGAFECEGGVVKGAIFSNLTGICVYLLYGWMDFITNCVCLFAKYFLLKCKNILTWMCWIVLANWTSHPTELWLWISVIWQHIIRLVGNRRRKSFSAYWASTQSLELCTHLCDWLVNINLFESSKDTSSAEWWFPVAPPAYLFIGFLM